MKKVTLLCGLLLAITAGVAAAAPGVNIRWTACAGDGGAINRTFACTSNTGQNLLTMSFQVGEDILQASGQEIVVDLASAGATLPAWWQMVNSGTCRQGALAVNTAISAAAVNCIDW